MRKPNIFYNLIRNEDSYTEAFINLMFIEEVRKEFCNLLTESLGTKITFDFDHINSQVNFNGEARPDIVIETDKFFLLIENKTNVYTEMTSAQKDYYKYNLKQNKDNYLIFLIPKMYKHIKDIDDTIIKANSDKLIQSSDKIFWEDVIPKIKNASEKESYQHFIEITEELFGYKNIIIEVNDVKELKNGSIQAFVKLNRIIENLKKTYSTEKYKIEEDLTEFNNGFHLIDRENNEYLLYFGVVYDLWLERNEPFYIGVHKSYNKSVKKKFEKLADSVINPDNDEYQYLEIPLQELYSTTDSTTIILDRINEFLK